MHFSTIFKASNHLLGYGVFVSLKYKHRASKRTINHDLTMFGSEKMVTCAKKENFLQLFSGLRSISNFASLYNYRCANDLSKYDLELRLHPQIRTLILRIYISNYAFMFCLRFIEKILLSY